MLPETRMPLNSLSPNAERIAELKTLFPEAFLEGRIDFDRLKQSLGEAIQRKFAAAFESRTDLKFYLKLPPWFKIQTPFGSYNPDWALVKQEAESEPKLYLVRETKSSLRQFDLRNSEEMKIVCSNAHFEALQPGLYAKACDPLQI